MHSACMGSFHRISVPTCRFQPSLRMKPQRIHSHCHYGLYPSPVSLSCRFGRNTSLNAIESDFDAIISLPEGAVSVMKLEEFVEKDWSVLDHENSSSKEEFDQRMDCIITAGKIEETSRVLVSVCSEEFVDRLVDSSHFKSLLIVHDSLLILALLKEKYDKIKCWQGEIVHVPEKWAPLDVVFLYFLPALPFQLDQILSSLAKKCAPGARLVISHPQGREKLEQQRREYPLVVVSELPDKMTLQRVAAAHSFDLAEFVDEPGLYLVVLIFSAAKD